jgi:hypothetical protein
MHNFLFPLMTNYTVNSNINRTFLSGTEILAENKVNLLVVRVGIPVTVITYHCRLLFVTGHQDECTSGSFGCCAVHYC